MVSAKKSRNTTSSVGSQEAFKEFSGDSEKCIPDPFSNEIVLSPFDWARLSIGSVFLMPVRALAVILTLALVRLFSRLTLLQNVVLLVRFSKEQKHLN